MQADFSVELGADDPTLTVPWASPDGEPRYRDLRAHPDLLLYIEEAIRCPELGEFLAHVNSERSRMQSAKCDVWFTTELNEEEQIYGAAGKFGGYVDLFFTAPEERCSFSKCEEFARQLTSLLRRAPELPSSVEVILRRAQFEQGMRLEGGFYFTSYVFGYGDEQEDARRHWAVSLKLLENALLQLASHRPPSY
jgi:hypothetical protein